MENIVLYIEKEKFLRQTFELLFKKNGVSLYTTDNIEENYYLINDLRPNIIIFDIDSVNQDGQLKLLSLSEIKLVGTGKNEPTHFNKAQLHLFLLKPIEIQGLFSKIINL